MTPEFDTMTARLKHPHQSSLRPVARALAAGSLLTLLAGCAALQEATDDPVAALPKPQRDLASFALPPEQQACFDRSSETYTPVVDAHFHPRPFGGPAIPPQELFGYFDQLGVRFVNYFGIGQILEMDSGCTYYLDCPGVLAMPSIKNDFVNGMEAVAYPNDNLNIVLSMTFMDLAHPENVVETIELYDREYPGMFGWAGELNVVKQALLGNLHEPATLESIDAWAPFMAILQERNIPGPGQRCESDGVPLPDGPYPGNLPGEPDRVGAHGLVQGTDHDGSQPACGADEGAAGRLPEPDAGYFLGRAVQRLPPVG